jgi:hypothetical protein
MDDMAASDLAISTCALGGHVQLLQRLVKRRLLAVNPIHV